MGIVVYDCETLRLAKTDAEWDTPWLMGFGSACLYQYDTDEYFFFQSHQAERLELMLKGNTVVSFNGIRFDNMLVVGEGGIPQWKDLDLLQLIAKHKHGMSLKEAMDNKGKWAVLDGSLGLDKICMNTLGVGKSGKGTLAPQMIRSGQWADLFAYNLQDVRRLKQLFEFIGNEKYVIDGKGVRIDIPTLC